MSFLCLYEKSFNALGNWNQHRVKSYSLKKKSQELDEFTATCQEWEDSKNACFVGLHDDNGLLTYLCFSGIPSTKKGLTTVNGTDCLALFDQELLIDYSQRSASGTSYTVNSAASLFKFLLKELFDSSHRNIPLAVDYEVNVDDVVDAYVTWDGTCVYDEPIVLNVLSEIKRLCRYYNLFISPEVTVDRVNNTYILTYKVKRIYKQRAIRLADFEVAMSRDSNSINMAIATCRTYHTNYYLHNNDVVDTTYSASTQLFPLKCKEFVEEVDDDATSAEIDEAFSKAKTKAKSALLKARYRDRCQIDLRNQNYAASIADVDFTYIGNLNGYNPADPNTVKDLPVSEIHYDENGKKSIVFGFLSEYWFLDEE